MTLREGAIEALVRYLMDRPDEVGAEAACGALANLAVFSPGNQHAVREAGGIAALVSTLRWASDDLRAPVMAEAARALGNLARNFTNKDEVRRAGGIRELVGLLAAGPASASASEAVVALGTLACDSSANQNTIVSAGGLPRLLSLLGADGTEPDLAQAVAAVVASLAACEEAVDALTARGSIGILVRCLRSWATMPLAAEGCLGTLAILATQPAGAEAVLANKGAIPACVGVLAAHDSPQSLREVAAVALGNFAVGSAVYQDAVRAAGGLSVLVEVATQAAPTQLAPAELLDACFGRAEQNASPAKSEDLPLSSFGNGRRGRTGWTPRHLFTPTKKKASAGSSTPPSSGKSRPDTAATPRTAHNALVMEVLVQLMASGPENMVSEVAESALSSMAERLAVASSPAKSPAHRAGSGMPVHVREPAAVPAAGLSKHCGPSQILPVAGDWQLPAPQPTWRGDEEEDGGGVIKSVDIDPLRSKQVRT